MSRLRIVSLVAAILLCCAWAKEEPAENAPTVQAAETPVSSSAEDARTEAQARAFMESLTRRTGLVTIAGGRATLNVPDTHYFIGAEDARRVIVDLWGNPPETGHVEGMIFPRDGNPATGSWGAVVEYSSEGYVSDADASTTDYDQLLQQMQEAAVHENEARRSAGFPEVTLVGWAEAPHYDPTTHKIYWGKDLRFGSESIDTLNYDIRVLGREGFVIVSFVATMPELDQIRGSIPAVLQMVEFTSGNRYADYREGIDQRAAYGIGGLIAGGAVAAVAQKTGIIALILAFGKKFIVLLGLGLAAVVGWIGRVLGGKKDEPPSM